MEVRGSRIGYLYSRYPVFSQTFCDSEMLALEAKHGVELVVGSINPPPSTFRHERFEDLRAEVVYGAPGKVMQARLARAEAAGGAGWEAMRALVEAHEERYGPEFKAWTRARNAVYFAEEFLKRGVGHVHVHFTNRATHTALFMKAYAGLPFSITAHGQDFMVDLGSDELLGELCREAAFVAVVSDASARLLAEKAAGGAGRVVRVYNGLEPGAFPRRAHVEGAAAPLRVVGVGRLLELKGFQDLIRACAALRADGIEVACTIIGEGEWRGPLEALVDELGMGEVVALPGVQTQEEIKRVLGASDVFALPCIVDGKGASDVLPTVITEAMAAGLPVVSTRLVGVPEMVVDGETGLLVEPGDVVGLTGALRRLAEDGELRGRFGAAGVARVREVFDLEKTSGQLLGLIDEAAGRGDGDWARPEVLCLVEAWPGDEYSLLNSEVAWLAEDGRFKVVAMRLAAGFKPERDGATATGLGGIEFMPDEVVLEAEGDDGGGDVEMERRVRYLGSLVTKLGMRHVHACRASLGETAKRVAEVAGVTYSVGVESGNGVAKEELEAVLEGAQPGVCGLDLALPVPRRRIKIGPLKFRWPPRRWEEVDRSAMYADWYGKL